MSDMHKDVCIVGGGASGMILALLLAKVGLNVLILEKNADFSRDYQGEVLQPRFVEMMEQLGLRRYLEQYPHLKLEYGGMYYKDKMLAPIDFTRMVPACPYALWVPQMLLLQALYNKADELPGFRMMFQAQVKELLYEGEQIVGMVADTKHGEQEIRAKVTVGADGRFSAVRKLGNFELEYDHYENDLAWFTTKPSLSFLKTLRILLTKSRPIAVLPKYPDSIECGIGLKKGEWKEIQERGIQAMRQDLKEASELFHDFADNLTDFTPFTIEQVRIMLVKKWAKDGCLLIGDAAHCATSTGGVGVSLSVGTAITAARVISEALSKGDVSAHALGRLQRIRENDIRHVHRAQIKQEAFQSSSHSLHRAMTPYLLSFLAGTPLFSHVSKNMYIMAKSLAIDPKFSFDDTQKNKNFT